MGRRFVTTIFNRGKPTEVDIEVTRSERPKVLDTRSVMAGSMVIGELRLDLWPLAPDSAGTGT